MTTDRISKPQQVVYVVDDDASARDSLCWLLGTEKLRTRAFASAGEFLAAWSSDWSGCITLDIRMPDMSGLQVQQELLRRGNLMPIIILTGHADVPVAIHTLKAGAFDFLEKPYSDETLMQCIKSALELEREIRGEQEDRLRLADVFRDLTAREREVMKLVVDGNTNKSIAAMLGISEKTVEIHRARVMRKTGAGSLSELVRLHLSVDQG